MLFEGFVWEVESVREHRSAYKAENSWVYETEVSVRIFRSAEVEPGRFAVASRDVNAECLVLASEGEHELTAKEYAEKLREAFGVKLEAVDHFEDLEICDGVNCRECPFDKRLKAAGYRGNCIALIVYHPELAVKLMDEWQAEKNKPKGKTYLEDFREKMPNAYIDPNFGTPAACRKRMYYHEIDDLKCGRKHECSKCWNEEMPEVSDNAEG